jgi:hypothetical protein
VCESFADAACVAFDVSATQRAYCFSTCRHGTPELRKCGNRTDTACEKLESEQELGFCRPFCTSDEDCGERRCDRRHGVCTEALPESADFGRPCSTATAGADEAEEANCSGICVLLDGSDIAVCSHRCIYGDIKSCTGSKEAPSLCALAAGNGSVGDVGYCAELCDSSEQCQHPDVCCDPFSSQTVRDLVGRAGVCAATTGGDTGAVECVAR